jgi:hypothetical protein
MCCTVLAAFACPYAKRLLLEGQAVKEAALVGLMFFKEESGTYANFWCGHPPRHGAGA